MQKNIDRKSMTKKSQNRAVTKHFYHSFICHRIPERTFSIKGHYFPVCARCTGIYLGSFSYFALVSMVRVDYNVLLLATAVLMVVPTFLDGFTQLLGERESNNTLRFATGIMGGLGLGIMVKALKYFLLM